MWSNAHGPAILGGMGTNNLGAMFLTGGWVMWPLLIFSILTWAVVIERAYVFLTLKPRLTRLSQDLLRSLRSGDVTSARQLCQSQQPLLNEIFGGVLDGSRKGREAAERNVERNRVRLVTHLRKNLWILGTIGSASPFIGLLGTVVGIVRAFHNMSEKGAGGFSVVAGGISEALIATAAGLVVAIIALLTYNIFVTAANNTITQMKLTLDEMLDQTFDRGTVAS